jgi:uncharacterized integral membrane protein
MPLQLPAPLTRGISVMQIVRWIVWITIFVALLLFSIQNAEQVKLRFFNLLSLEAPLIFVVLVVFAAGVAAGLLAGAIKGHGSSGS